MPLIAPQLTKADGVVDWSKTAVDIYNRLRAYTPWPGQSSVMHGKRVKLISVSPVDERVAGPPGTVLKLRSHSLEGGGKTRFLPVVCGDGSLLALHRVQLAGKKPVAAADFANGERLRAGERFVEV